MTKSSRLGLLLALLGAGSALVYAAALARFPLLAIYHIPLQNLDKLTGSAPGTGMVLFGCVLLLFIGYSLGVLALFDNQLGRWGWLFVLLPPAIFIGLLLFVYPTTSLDVYDYLFRGRMAVRYGANNFLAVPADYATDPLMASTPFRFIPWSRAVTAYGPLWEALSAATASLAGERRGPMPPAIDPSLRYLILGYKALGALGYAACGAAIWLAMRDSPRRGLAVFVWLWNPLVLWESVAAGHNDAWMATAIVLAVGVMGREAQNRRTTEPQNRELRTANQGFAPLGRFAVLGSRFFPALIAFLALTVGGLIKYLALLFGPLMVAAALRRLPTWRQRVVLLTLGALTCSSVLVLAYAPFWQGTATLRNFSDRGTLFYATWLAAVQVGLVETHIATKELSQQLVSALASGLLLAGVGWSAWRGWRAPERVAAHTLWLLLWFLLIANPWFQPWYVLWALALIALQPERERLLAAVVLLSFTASVSYIAGSFLLPVLGWTGESAAWNLLLACWLYGPSLLVLVVRRPFFFFDNRQVSAQT